jgi:hypothetical protein
MECLSAWTFRFSGGKSAVSPYTGIAPHNVRRSRGTPRLEMNREGEASVRAR